MRIDLGDVIAHFTLEVPGLRRYGIRWRVGAPMDTTLADRTNRTPGVLRSTPPTPRKVAFEMDLQADKKVALSVQWTDEVGNPTDPPADGTGGVSYTVDKGDIIALTDNGDGTAVAAAVGNLGTAIVSVSAQAGGRTLTGDLALTVVAGLAERVNIVAGPAEEVTPDDVQTGGDGTGGTGVDAGAGAGAQTGPEVGADTAGEAQPGA
jgi:hypothetical protein